MHKYLSLPIAVGILLIAAGSTSAQQKPLKPAAQPVQRFNLQTGTSAYRLGPSDNIEINVFGIPELSVTRTILPDGTATLPIVGSVRFADLSQEEASSELTELYRPYLERAQITVAVLTPRPMGVAILGQVNRPGPYTLNQVAGQIQGTSSKQSTGEGSVGGPGGGRLTVSQALNLAGGVTEVADVEEITVRRKLPGGSDIVKKVNLWAMLQGGDTAADIPLLDGDSVTVPRAVANKPNYDARAVGLSTLAPSTIEVKMLGEVRRPGLVNVSPNALLTDAIVAAGGLTDAADWKAVQLLRLNPDGTVTRTELAAYLEQGRDQQKNPELRKGDLINVPRSFGGSIVKTIGELNPFLFVLNLFGLRF